MRKEEKPLKLLTRREFREAVFARDNHKCVVCGDPADDAHHILERRLWGTSSGYYIDNGASVCEPCHLKCGRTEISCESLRELCGITRTVLPTHLYPDSRYDLWGNIILENGTRLPGELFLDVSVQKILEPVLYLFRKHVKYPRTYHVSWSPGVTRDDRIIDSMKELVGQRVIVTEKKDGECLATSTKIAMADGSFKSISTLVREGSGEYVLGVDSLGKVVPSKITKVYKNGKQPEGVWTKVRVKGAGSPSHSVFCTPNHEFFSIDKYTKAKDLNEGDTVSLLKVRPSISTRQEQILLGMLLGDGSFHVHNEDTALIQWSHKEEHREYMDWINLSLGEATKGKFCTCTSGYGTTMLKSWSICCHDIYLKYKDMIVNGVKTVPKSFSDRIGPIALAFWVMDDGSISPENLQRGRIQLSVCGFDKTSIDNLRNSLLQLYGIKSSMTTCRRGYRYINITADSTEVLASLISPYVVTCMRYKLPSMYRKFSSAVWEKEVQPSFSQLKHVKVISVGKGYRPKETIRYDIETETGNYFANYVLVHNCTSLYNDFIHARALDYTSHPSRGRVKALHDMIRHDIPEGWRVCGENLTAVHSIKYEDLPSFFLVFSIWDQYNRCLSWNETVEYTEMLGLVTVPVLYDGIYDEDEIKSLYDEDKDREVMEGYVIRLADEFQFRQFRHVVCKYVRAGHVQETHGHWYRRQVEFNGVLDD